MPFTVVAFYASEFKVDVMHVEDLDSVVTVLRSLMTGKRCIPMVFEGTQLAISGGAIRYLMLPDGTRKRITAPEPEIEEDCSPVFGSDDLSDEEFQQELRKQQSIYYGKTESPSTEEEESDEDN